MDEVIFLMFKGERKDRDASGGFGYKVRRDVVGYGHDVGNGRNIGDIVVI